MSAIVWDAVGEKYYEAGCSKGVLYTQTGENGAYATGVPWNGLINVSESPSGAEPTPLYADNVEYASMMSAEKFAATIEAYMAPEEFDKCDGVAEIAKGVTVGQQNRVGFGLCYRTEVGNDVAGLEKGYKIHIIYGCKASPSEKSYGTINDNPDAITFSWSVNATPVDIPGKKPSATITIDSRTVTKEVLEAIEAKLYGGTDAEATLPTPAELIELIKGVTTPGV